MQVQIIQHFHDTFCRWNATPTTTWHAAATFQWTWDDWAPISTNVQLRRTTYAPSTPHASRDDAPSTATWW